MIPAILVALLGSNHFPVREAAYLSLDHLGPHAAVALSAGEHHRDPEVRSRCAMLLDPLRADCLLPYIDSMPYDSIPNRGEAIYRLVARCKAAGIPDRTANDWPAYREATRLWLAEGGDAKLLTVMRMRTRCYDAIGKWEPD